MNTSQIKQAAFLHRDPDASALPDMDYPYERIIAQPVRKRIETFNLVTFALAVLVIVGAMYELIAWR
jgi:hypothetical protein